MARRAIWFWTDPRVRPATGTPSRTLVKHGEICLRTSQCCGLAARDKHGWTTPLQD